MSTDTIFRNPTHRTDYEALADDLATIYRDAVRLRNQFADTTRTTKLRREGRELTEALEAAADTAKDILEEIADETDAVDTEYMVNEGWELSYHDPDDLPDDLVVASRITEAVLAAYTEINWLFDDTLSNGVPDGEECTRAADRVTEQFDWLETQFDRIDITVTE